MRFCKHSVQSWELQTDGSVWCDDCEGFVAVEMFRQVTLLSEIVRDRVILACVAFAVLLEILHFFGVLK